MQFNGGTFDKWWANEPILAGPADQCAWRCPDFPPMADGGEKKDRQLDFHMPIPLFPREVKHDHQRCPAAAYSPPPIKNTCTLGQAKCANCMVGGGSCRPNVYGRCYKAVMGGRQLLLECVPLCCSRRLW